MHHVLTRRIFSSAATLVVAFAVVHDPNPALAQEVKVRPVHRDFSPSGAQKWIDEHGGVDGWNAAGFRPVAPAPRGSNTQASAAVPDRRNVIESRREALLRTAAIREICGRALGAQRQLDLDVASEGKNKQEVHKHEVDRAKWAAKCKAAKALGPWDAKWKPGKGAKVPPANDASDSGGAQSGGPSDPTPQECLPCGPGGPEPALDVRVTHFFSTILLLLPGDTVRATTSNLHLPAGLPSDIPMSARDSRLILMKCEDSDCSSGDVVAVDDNSNWATPCPIWPLAPTSACFDSAFTVVVPAFGFYRLAALATDPGGDALGDVHVWRKPAGGSCTLSCAPTSPGGLPLPFCSQTCPSIVSETDVMLGGLPTVGHELAVGDAVLVGARQIRADEDAILNAPPSEYHDSELFALSRAADDCIVGQGVTCGKFRYSDDVVVGDWNMKLSRIDLKPTDADEGAPTWTGPVVVGGFDEWQALASDPPGQTIEQTPHDFSHMVVPGFRLLVNRRHRGTDGLGVNDEGGAWCCDERKDWDGDGLSWELEQAVGSCDVVDDFRSEGGLVVGLMPPRWNYGSPKYTCRDMANLVKKGVEEWDADRGSYWNSEPTPRGPCPAIPPPGANHFANASWPHSQLQAGEFDNPNCWRASDSDNDGLQDPWEVWGVAFRCTKVPVAPFWDTGTCTPLKLSETPPANDQECQAGPGQYCFAEPLSARSGVAPDVFDVIVDVVYQTCDYLPSGAASSFCAGSHPFGEPTQHRFSNGPGELQGVTAHSIFTEEPQTCFDGSLPPCQDSDRDLPYRTNFHVYNAYAMHRMDDTTWSELLATFDGAFNQAQNPRLWGRISHQMGLNHGGDCATAGLYTGCGNAHNVYDTAALLHELGHGLGLKHDQGPTNCGDGCINGKNVSSCEQEAGAATLASCDTSTLQGKRNINLPSVSIMGFSYVNKGAVEKTSDLNSPVVTEADCRPEHSRFSKGLSPCLDEAHLHEDMDGANSVCPGDEPKTGLWRVKRLARDLKCFRSEGECPILSTFGYVSGSGPSCAGPSCQFDWNRDNQVEGGEYRFDASRGNTWPSTDTNAMCIQTAPGGQSLVIAPPPWPGPGGGFGGGGGLPPPPPICSPPWPPGTGTCAPSGQAPQQDKCACNDDILHDIDQWRRMVSVGRYAAEDAQTWKGQIAVYMDSFNGKQAHNEAGWSDAQMPVEAVGTFNPAEEVYPINLCANAGQLQGGQACVKGCLDASICSAGQTCEPANITTDTGKACTCDADLDCPGSLCMNGQCVDAAIGRVTCAEDSDCVASGNSAPACQNGFCSKRHHDGALPIPGESPRRSSFHLRGPGSNDHIRLVDTGGPSPLDAVVWSGGLRLRLDVLFRWHPGDPARTIWRWGDLSLELIPGTTLPHLRASAGPTQVTVNEYTDPIMPGRWYRISLWLTNYPGFAPVTVGWEEMSITTGLWGPLKCARQSGMSPAIPANADVYFGSESGGDGTSNLEAQIDNITMLNFWPSGDYPTQKATPITCAEVTP